MIRQKGIIRIAVLCLVVGLLISGCDLLKTTPVGERQTETRTVEAEGAGEASVLLGLGAGKLAVVGGADAVMQATFVFNVDEWRPKVSYSVSGDRGDLAVHQSGENLPVGAAIVNEWNVQLGDDIPIDLEIDAGAAESAIDLRGLDLSSLKIGVGAGSTSVDLSGSLGHDLTATISSGAGDLSVTLPQDMGVRVSAEIGLGGLTHEGLSQDGDFYVNDAYGESPHTLFVEITAGAGSVELLSR